MKSKAQAGLLGHYIKAKRKEKGLSIRGLGRKIKRDATYLSSIERNKHGYIPSTTILKEISKSLGLNVEILKSLRKPIVDERAELWTAK